MQDLSIAYIQFDIAWQNPTKNQKLLEKLINSIASPVDLIILPEMFTTGFTMETELNAEHTNGATLQWMQKMAHRSGAVVTGSLIIKESSNYFNRLFWVTPDGNYTHYDKRHLFRMADEHTHFTQGKIAPIFELNGWRIKPQICYDLRFPVWSRNTEVAYDVIFFVANWPKARITAWDTLLKARAIENSCYCIGVNRVGVDGNNKTYNGHSACYNFKGELASTMLEGEAIHYIRLSKKELERYINSFPTHLDADTFNINTNP